MLRRNADLDGLYLADGVSNVDVCFRNAEILHGICDECHDAAAPGLADSCFVVEAGEDEKVGVGFVLWRSEISDVFAIDALAGDCDTVMERAVGNPNGEVVIGDAEDGRNDGLEIEVLVGAPPFGANHKVLHLVVGFHGAAFEEKSGGGDVREIVADVYASFVRDGIILHIFLLEKCNLPPWWRWFYYYATNFTKS